MTVIDPYIFRAYDIRGKAHKQINEEVCKLVGQAFGSTLRKLYQQKKPRVAVGRDARLHSESFQRAVIDGLTLSGCQVFNIGLTPSPVNYFTILAQKLDGGIQVTASHNPADDNGLKLQIRNAEPFSGNSLQELKDVILNEDFLLGVGSVENIDAISPYKTYLKNIFKNAGKNKKIIIDCGNGVTGPVYGEVFKQTGANVAGLFLEPDGNFPNHPADPSKTETLKDLQEYIKQEQSDIGFAFDGDGDRLGVVDEQGDIRSADEILLILARDHLSRHAGKTVVFTVSNSGALESEILKWGGQPVMTKVGHSYVEHAMLETNSLLGGEQSGHFFCAEDYFPFDDALAAALRLLTVLQTRNCSFSQLFSGLPKVYQLPEKRPFCDDADKAVVMQKITEHFHKYYKINTLDGVRIDFGDFAWAGIRQSNTSPCLSVCMEARSEEKLKEIDKIVTEHLKTYDEIDFS